MSARSEGPREAARLESKSGGAAQLGRSGANGPCAPRLRLRRLQVLLRKVHQARHDAGRGLRLLVRDDDVAGPGAKAAAVHAAGRDAGARLRLAVQHGPPVQQRRVEAVHLRWVGGGAGHRVVRMAGCLACMPAAPIPRSAALLAATL